MIFFFVISKRYKHSPWFQPRERNICLARIVYPWLKPRAIFDNWIFVAYANAFWLRNFFVLDGLKSIPTICFVSSELFTEL